MLKVHETKSRVTILKFRALKVKVDSVKNSRNIFRQERARIIFRGRIMAFRDGRVREKDCF